MVHVGGECAQMQTKKIQNKLFSTILSFFVSYITCFRYFERYLSSLNIVLRKPVRFNLFLTLQMFYSEN